MHSLLSPSSTNSATTSASSSSTATSEDHLIDLPDTLCLHILSLLPLKYAIRTGALSSRWHDLWKYRWPHPSSLDLSTAAASFGYSLSILNLVTTDPIDEQIHLAATIHFKNHLRSRWSPPLHSLPPSPASPLSDTVMCFPSLPRHHMDPPSFPYARHRLPSCRIHRSPSPSPPARMPPPVAITGFIGAPCH